MIDALGDQIAALETWMLEHLAQDAIVRLLLTIPGIGLDKSFRFGGFVDAGYVWATSQKMRLSDLRYSIGVSVAWSSPFGPLKVSIAQPLNKKSGDQIEHFQFQMGTSF